MDIKLLSPSLLQCGDYQFRCAIGKEGLVNPHEKREGDHKTPRGVYPLRACYFRPDKWQEQIQTELLLVEIRRDMGWCDDASHPRYNQLVSLPFSASHEQLWREDDCYDIVIPIGYNDDPIVQGQGSAIFLHLAQPDYRGTEGCVALSKEAMWQLLPNLTKDSSIHIQV